MLDIIQMINIPSLKLLHIILRIHSHNVISNQIKEIN